MVHPDTGKSQEYRHLIKGSDKEKWTTSFSNEFGRLTQGGNNRIVGTNTIFFTHKIDVPFETKKLTYGKIVCSIKPHKEETHRTRLTVGGNLLDFNGKLTTPTATVTTAKCLFNSVVSTKNARCVTADVKNFYLNNTLPEPEYMKMPLSIIPEEVIAQYQLHKFVDTNGWVYMKICKGMYGLKQAGIIANDELIKHLKPYGYHPVKFTPGLWKHTDNDTIFSLVVDDFAIKYTSMEKANHLLNALKDKYTISIDWDASLYIGISLEWDYNKRTLKL